MQTRTLATALAAAMTISTPASFSNARLNSRPAEKFDLLNALRNSATGRDQIVQRRIGLFPDTAVS